MRLPTLTAAISAIDAPPPSHIFFAGFFSPPPLIFASPPLISPSRCRSRFQLTLPFRQDYAMSHFLRFRFSFISCAMLSPSAIRFFAAATLLIFHAAIIFRFHFRHCIAAISP
jgi:hypothetical protein